MEQQFTLKEYQIAFRKLVKKEAKRGFIIHFFFYIFINIGLVIVNFVTKPDFLWFYWPLVFWGFVVMMHYIFGVILSDKDLEKKEALAEKWALEELSKKQNQKEI